MQTLQNESKTLSVKPGTRVRMLWTVDKGNTAWDEITQWCMQYLYHGGHYEPNWWADYPFIYFTDEKEYMLFTLRWP